MADPPTDADITLNLLSQARWLAPVRALAGSFSQRVGFGELLAGQISLAIDEALCNVINHGYDRRPDGPIWISFSHVPADPPRLKVIVQDRAKQVDPGTIQPRALEDIRPGGLGVYIIREIMDEVVYEQRDGGGMQLTMTKIVPVSSNDEAGTTVPSQQAHKGAHD